MPEKSGGSVGLRVYDALHRGRPADGSGPSSDRKKQGIPAPGRLVEPGVQHAPHGGHQTQIGQDMKIPARRLWSVISAGSLWMMGGLPFLDSVSAQEGSPVPSPAAVESTPPPQVDSRCVADLTPVGRMKDVLSNVLLRVEGKPGAEVRAFLETSPGDVPTGASVLAAAADRFQIDPERLAQLVDRWRHINCWHAEIPGYVIPDAARQKSAGEPVPRSVFATDVTVHVVFHEIGHAVIREFDLMVLGNEETMADAFATHLLTEHFPERALAVISARVRSLMIEAEEVPREEWSVRGEHDNDARRAYQIAALAITADRARYAAVAEIVRMSERDIERACDYGSDIHRAWRRTLSPLLMPAGRTSKEARFRADAMTRAFVDDGDPSLESIIRSALQRIDWHSQVTVDFVDGRGGAAWNRSKRTVTVNSEYLRRFIAQGAMIEARTRSTDLEPPR